MVLHPRWGSRIARDLDRTLGCGCPTVAVEVAVVAYARNVVPGIDSDRIVACLALVRVVARSLVERRRVHIRPTVMTEPDLGPAVRRVRDVSADRKVCPVTVLQGGECDVEAGVRAVAALKEPRLVRLVYRHGDYWGA